MPLQRAVDDRLAEIDTSPSIVRRRFRDRRRRPVVTSIGARCTRRRGVPFTTRILVDVAIGQTGSQGFSIPPGSVFAVTDLVIQNPNRDVGTAALLRNSDTLYQWNLVQLQSNNEFQPRVTALVFQPNDTIVLQATCEGAGSTVGTGCSIAVLLSGEMRPAT